MRVYLDACCLQRPLDDRTQTFSLTDTVVSHGNRSQVGDWSNFRLKNIAMQIRVLRKHGPVPLKSRHIVNQGVNGYVVDTLRFLSQFRPGIGDYTADRGEWLETISMDEIVSEIKSKQPDAGQIAPDGCNRSRVGVWSIFRLKNATMQTRVVRKHGPDPLELRET